MTVRVCYMSDRDEGRLFTTKKEADAHDKMLELAENLTALMAHRFPAIGEQMADEIGLFLAHEKELLHKAIRGNPEVIVDWMEQQSGKVADLPARQPARKSSG